MTTPNNHVLIDYENVQPEVAERLAPGFFKVWVFVGALQNKVKFDLLDLVQAKGSDAKVIRMGGTGPNALDFHMAYHLGRLCRRAEACCPYSSGYRQKRPTCISDNPLVGSACGRC